MYIATDPDFDGKKVDPEEIVPGSVVALRLMLDIALGSDEKLKRYGDEFTNRTGPAN